MTMSPTHEGPTISVLFDGVVDMRVRRTSNLASWILHLGQHNDPDYHKLSDAARVRGELLLRWGKIAQHFIHGIVELSGSFLR